MEVWGCGEGGVFLKYSGPSGLGSFFVIDVTDEAVTSKKYILRYTRKVVFSRVLGSRFFANSFFIVFSKLFHSFLIVINVTDEAVTSKKYILRYTRRKNNNSV